MGFLAIPLHAQQGYKESFDNVTDGQALSVMKNWSQTSGSADAWKLTATGGCAGGGVEVSSLGICQLKLPDDQSMKNGSGPYQLRLKIKIDVPNDAYTTILVDLRGSGGVNGLGIRLNGGKEQGSEDNGIEVSQGGTFWGDIQYQHVAAPWQTATWYQVEIDNIHFSTDGVTGSLTIYPVQDPKTKLVENKPVLSYGKAESFQTIDLISIGSTGAERRFIFDDIEFGPATKP